MNFQFLRMFLNASSNIYNDPTVFKHGCFPEKLEIYLMMELPPPYISLHKVA